MAESPDDLILLAWQTLDGSTGLPARRRARAAAVLVRTALESAVEERVGALAGMPIGTRTMSHRLICLRVLADERDRERGDREEPEEGARARQAAWSFSALSSACHQHAYELDPGVDEIEHLIGLVEAVSRTG